MSKLRSDPIIQADIEDYLNDYADFSFELQVLKELTDLGLQCSHNGTYDDPITGKSREFDIRALLQDRFIRVHLSIECKNIRDNFPLVLHCMKRRESESYNELIHTFEPKGGDPLVPPAFQEFSESISVSQTTLYSKDNYVAKSADQVGRREHNNEITATDGGVFDKISQAINSAKDLIEEAHYLEINETSYLTFVCPVLVIPDSVLWQVKYSTDGAHGRIPEQVNHISYYIGKEWTVGGKFDSLTYNISHLEIVTFSQVKTFVEEYLRGYVEICNAVVGRGGQFS